MASLRKLVVLLLLVGAAAALRERRAVPDATHKAKVCPSTIPNGNLASFCSAAYGSTCNYTCNDGYEYNIRASNISCVLMEWSSEHNVKWSVDVHSLCTNSNQCTYEISGVELDVSCLRNVGDTCRYECTYGLSPTSDSITCEQSSYWNKALSSLCKTTQCPDTIPNGYIPLTCERYVGSRCDDYQCNTNYTLTGERRALWCSDSGSWQADDFHIWFDDPWTSDLQDFCTRTHCPETIQNGIIPSTCLRNIGSVCQEYQCNSNYTRPFETLGLRCTLTGNWIWNYYSKLLGPYNFCILNAVNTECLLGLDFKRSFIQHVPGFLFYNLKSEAAVNSLGKCKH